MPVVPFRAGVAPTERGLGAWLSFRREKVPGTAPIALKVARLPTLPCQQTLHVRDDPPLELVGVEGEEVGALVDAHQRGDALGVMGQRPSLATDETGGVLEVEDQPPPWWRRRRGR